MAVTVTEPNHARTAGRSRVAFLIAVAAVIVVFGPPLFSNLGATDFKGDEPIYSFAIDRILDQGGWLTPKSIPDDHVPFLEKPPLKFWIVAASVKAGLLPRNEFGYRFWDALFGLAAFVYVLAIGFRMSGVVCGLTAVLVLFTHAPLLFEHGLRSNNMEAGLLLAYCGGMFHAMAWAEAANRRARWGHAIAFGLWCAFGFLIKFVAVIFLPGVVFLTALIHGRWRRRLLEDWAIWLGATALALALAAPWFVYETRLFGRDFWNSIFGVHIVMRFTSYLDPAHLKPWYFYLGNLSREISWSNDVLLVSAGLAVLIYQAVVRRSPHGILLLTWLVVPIAAISSVTSKLYHYIYPFLPPLALAAGLVPPAVMEWTRRHSAGFAAILQRVWPAERSRRLPAALRVFLTGLAIVAIGLALITPITGGLSLRAGHVMVFRNSTVSRPLIAAIVLLFILGRLQTVPTVFAAALLLVAMPFDAYRNIGFVERMQPTAAEGAPMRTLRDCLVRLQHDGLPSGVYVHTPDPVQWRYTYYLRDAGWTENAGDDRQLRARLLTPGQTRPVFMSNAGFARLQHQLATEANGGADARRLARMRRIVFDDGTTLALPDRYAVCSDVSGGGTQIVGTR